MSLAGSGIAQPFPGWQGLAGKPFVTVSASATPDGSDYGAFTSGTTTSGIQEAINSLGSVGGTVSLKAGTFTVSTLSTVKVSGTTIQGQGEATVISLANSSNVSIFALTSGIQGVIFKEFQIAGNSTNNTSGHGLDISNGSHVWVSKIYVNSCAQDGIHMVETSQQNSVFLTECISYLNKGDGFHLDGGAGISSGNFYISMCRAVSNTGKGLYAANTAGSMWFINCDSDSNSNAGVLLQGTAGGTIVGGYSTDNGSIGVQLTNCQNIVIIGHATESNVSSNNATGIYVDATCKYIDISGCNLIENIGTGTIYGIRVLSGATHVSLGGNDVSQVTTGTPFPISIGTPIGTDILVFKNRGYKVAKSSITAGTSPYTLPLLPYDAIYVITTVGGMTALTLDGQALAPIAAVGDNYYVAANHTLIATWATTAPIFEILPI